MNSTSEEVEEIQKINVFKTAIILWCHDQVFLLHDTLGAGVHNDDLWSIAIKGKNNLQAETGEPCLEVY